MTHLASNGTTDLGWAGMTSSFTSGFSQPDNGQGGSDHADVGLYAFGTFNAGELVRITETHAWGTPTIGLVVVFVPTPANPQ